MEREGFAQDYGIKVSAQDHEGLGLVGIDDKHAIQHGNAITQFREGGCAGGPSGQKAWDIRRSPPYKRVGEGPTGFRDKRNLLLDAAAGDGTAGDGEVQDRPVAREAVFL